MNRTFVSAASRLVENGFNITHQTGSRMYDETLQMYKEIGISMDKIKVLPYILDMSSAFKWADLVVARSGAGSVYEISYAEKPALYIPFASASGNHQYFNAISAKNRGYCEILEEKDFSVESLINSIEMMFQNLDHYKKSLHTVQRYDSASIIVNNMITEISK